MNEPGTISIGENDTLFIEVEGESYRIESGDFRTLLFHCRVVPIIQIKRKTSQNGEPLQTLSIEGHAAMNRAGKAVLIFTRAGYFIIPLWAALQVARWRKRVIPRWKRWRLRNPEKNKAQRKAYYWRNRDKIAVNSSIRYRRRKEPNAGDLDERRG